MKRSSIKKRNISGKFTCDICNAVEYLEEHHINGRKIKDYNNFSNICNICPNCHYKIHLGKIVIERWAMGLSGMSLFWHYDDEEGTFTDSNTHIIK